jgi:hypothetical protein
MPTFEYTNPGEYTVAIPGNAVNITAVVRGARGGRGGTDAGAQGGPGGVTTIQNFTFTQNFVTRTVRLWVGGAGGNGVDSQGSAAGGAGGYGLVSGGTGGRAGSPPFSGGGGGGGGASAVGVDGSGVYIVMGGAGGGGGASDNRSGAQGGFPSVSATPTTSISPTAGGTGQSPGGSDGGGGGGGGGGVPGGAGGIFGLDNNRGGGGGSAGTSAYNVNFVVAGTATSGQGSFNGYVSISYDIANPAISTFNANPNPQGSFNGIPQYSTTLNWNTVNATTVTITSSAGETFSNLSAGGSLNITNLAQSVTGSNSPRIRSYTLTASNPGATTSSTIEVQAYNDNSPTTSWTTSFSNLEPSTEYEFFIGKLSGVDMPTNISVSGSGNFVGKSFGGQFTSSALFNDQDNVILKFTTLPFNTDISGETGIYGKSNSKTVPVTAGTQSFNVTVTTRPPRIAEDFNYFDNQGQYPYEDIDLITNNPVEYLNTAIVTADDIEVPVEIKTDNPDIQVRINNGTWTNIRQI